MRYELPNKNNLRDDYEKDTFTTSLNSLKKSSNWHITVSFSLVLKDFIKFFKPLWLD